MATFQFGRALLCALLTLSLAASCGPGDDQPDGGDCPLGGCSNTDGGTDGGGTPTTVDLLSPTDANPTKYAVTAKGDFSETLAPLACGQDVCTFTVVGRPGASRQGTEGADFTFTPEIPGFRTVEKSQRGASYVGKHYSLTWKDDGDCGIAIGDPSVGDGFEPYYDENRSEWGKVYFRTEVVCKGPANDPCSIRKVVLNDYGGVGARKILGGDNFVVVTGLTFSGRYDDSGGTWSQEFSGTISGNREEIVYHLVGRDASGNVTDEDSGTFRRFRQ